MDAVLPWDDPKDEGKQQYRLVLTTHYLSALPAAERQRTLAEFISFNTILGESNTNLPFYTYADEQDVLLWSAVDGRIPGNAGIDVWLADENFPWTVRLQFPTADEVLCYNIQAWFYEDDETEDAENQAGWFLLWLQPLYANQPSSEAILSLQAKPRKWLDLEQPVLTFQTQRNAECVVDIEAQTIDIVLLFRIEIDLGQGQWQFADSSSKNTSSA